MKNRLAILIPTFNRKDAIIHLLQQLYLQKKSLGLNVQIIVINDGSKDGTKEVIEKEFPEVNIVQGNGNWWYTKSINEGMKVALENNVDYILTLNDDIILSDDYLSYLKSYLDDKPTGITGSITYISDKPDKVFFAGYKKKVYWRNRLIKYYNMGEPIKQKDIQVLKPSICVPGRGMLINVDVIESIGTFDAYFKQYFSDHDFCERAVERGFPCLINYNFKIYAQVENTGKGSTFIQESFKTFISSFTSSTARNYIPYHFSYLWRHNKKIILPISLIMTILQSFKQHLKRNKIV